MQKEGIGHCYVSNTIPEKYTFSRIARFNRNNQESHVCKVQCYSGYTFRESYMKLSRGLHLEIYNI